MRMGSRLEAEMEVGAVPVLLSGGKEKKRNAKKRNRDLRDLRM